MPSVNPIVPRSPDELRGMAALALFFLYFCALFLLAVGITDQGGVGTMVFGGLLLCLAIYHTVRWIRAIKRDAAKEE